MSENQGGFDYFQTKKIHLRSLKEVEFFEPNCTGPLLQRLRLECPGTLSNSTEQCQILTNCSNSTYQYCHKPLSSLFPGDIKTLKIQYIEWRVSTLPFCFLQNKLLTIFIIKVDKNTRKQEKPRRCSWSASFPCPGRAPNGREP